MFQKFDVLQPMFTEHIYNIADFGAVGDGVTSNTRAFKEAIVAANKTGGRVLVPNGIWLTGPIELLSGVELHLSDNAIVLFDKNPKEYPLVITSYEGIARIRATSMLHAENADNIAITGRGIFDGNGHLWRPVKDWKMTKLQWESLLKVSPYVISGKESNIWAPSETFYEGYMAGEVSVEDCSFINADVGVRFKSAMGRGGVIEDIYMKRINMVNMKEEAIVLTMDYVLETLDAREYIAPSDLDEDVPEFKNIFIEDCLCVGAEVGVRIKGMEWKTPTIHDINIINCNFQARKENEFVNCENVRVE